MRIVALAEIGAQVRARKPDAGARAEARLAILDTLACIRAGMTHAGPVTTVAGADPAGRALVLGTAAHAIDFDDYEDLGSTHPSAAIVGALMALAEGGRVTLSAMEAAWIAGYETILCVGKALGYGHYLAGWHSSGTLGGIGAAAACAHLLDLDEERVADALSIAMTRAAGMKAQFGTPVKALHCGMAARAGVEAALLAKAGLRAGQDVADAFLALYGDPASPGWGAALPLPTVAAHPPYRKPWPSCAYTHRIAEAAERIAHAPGFEAVRVARGEVRMAAPYLAVAGVARPANADEARFASVFCAATMLLDRALLPCSFGDEQRARPGIVSLMARIETLPYPLPEGAGDMSADAPDTLSVVLDDGAILTETVAHPRGGPRSPLCRDAIVRKFRDCGGAQDAARAFLASPADAPFAAPA